MRHPGCRKCLVAGRWSLRLTPNHPQRCRGDSPSSKGDDVEDVCGRALDELVTLQFLIKSVECFSSDCQCGGIFEASIVLLVGGEVEESAEDFQDEGAVSRDDAVAFVKDKRCVGRTGD